MAYLRGHTGRSRQGADRETGPDAYDFIRVYRCFGVPILRPDWSI